MALLDWDNTLRRGFTLRDWTDYLVARGVISRQSTEVIHALFHSYSEGSVEYEDLAQRSADLYASAIRDVAEESMRSVAADFVAFDRKLHGFTRPLLTALTLTIDIVVISGCPEVVLNAYSSQLPFTKWFGLTLSSADAHGVDTARRNPALASVKHKLVAKTSTGTRVILALGDSWSDLPLFEAAEVRVVIDNPTLAEAFPRALAVSSSKPAEQIVSQILQRVRDAAQDPR